MKMRVGFDLDGTLDRPEVVALANALFAGGHEVHVISGMFPEDEAPWQTATEKLAKLKQLGVLYTQLHIVEALPVGTTRNLEYILRDLNLRKGDIIRRNEIQIMFDDSPYSDSMRGMCAATIARLL